MKPFRQAWYPEEAFDPLRLVADHDLNLEEAQRVVEEMRLERVFINDLYQVAVREKYDRSIVHLSIRRIDRLPLHDWRELQEIKNVLVGPECEGLEIYPAESRLVDCANQYHLWVFKDPAFRIPIGFRERLVREHPGGAALQRPFAKGVPK